MSVISYKSKIRAAAADAISAGVPDFGGRVFRSRVHPTDASDLPCALVYAEGETISASAGVPGRRVQSREISLVVVIVADGERPDLDEVIDDLSTQVEEVLMTAPAFSAVSGATLVTSFEARGGASALSGNGRRLYGLCRSEFVARWNAREGNPREGFAK